MSDGLSFYYKAAREPVSVRGWHRWNEPVVPRRVTEHGRMMWASDLGLPSYNAPPYFWLGREAE